MDPGIPFWVHHLSYETHSIVFTEKFVIASQDALSRNLGGKDLSKFDFFVLEDDEKERLFASYPLRPLSPDCYTAISNWGLDADGHYPLHSGRELDMMLRGEKPLAKFTRPFDAAFSDIEDQPFPEYAARGHFLQRQLSVRSADGERDFVLEHYFLPGQEWRALAAEALARVAYGWPWDLGSDLYEGILLGYTFEQAQIWRDIQFKRSPQTVAWLQARVYSDGHFDLSMEERPYPAHSGRELELMQAGEKPLAVFQCAPSEAAAYLEAFQPLVDNGLLGSCRVALAELGAEHDAALVLFYAQDEAWRVPAFLNLIELAYRVRIWDPGMRLLRDRLLGYSADQIELLRAKALGVSD